MLKNKIAIKKIRNVIFLGLIILIMLGVYHNNIKNSRAEDIVQMSAVIQDRNQLMSGEELQVEAVKNDDGTYGVRLPDVVNGKRVSKYYTSDGTEVIPTASTLLVVSENDVADNKVQIQLKYDSKQITNGGQTITAYNKVLSADLVTLDGYMPAQATLSADELDIKSLDHVVLPDANMKIEKAFNINVSNEGQTYQPISYGETLNVSIAYTATGTPNVYHIFADGTTEKVESRQEGSNIKFVAKSFSQYVIATGGQGTENTNAVENTVTNTVSNTTENTTVANTTETPNTVEEIVPKWSKVSSTVSEENMEIVIQGTGKSYASNSLDDTKIKVLVDGEEVQTIPNSEITKTIEEQVAEKTKEIIQAQTEEQAKEDAEPKTEEELAEERKQKIEEARQEITANVMAEAKKENVIVKLSSPENVADEQGTSTGVKYTVTLENFEQTTRKTNAETNETKSYLEWSGNVALKIAENTLTDSEGKINTEDLVEETEKVDKQTEDKMFKDLIKPEIVFKSSTTTIDEDKKSVVFEFEVIDKYYGENLITAENINVQVPEIENADTIITKELEKVSDINEKINGIDKKIGEKYILTISNIENLKITEDEKEIEYNGPIQIAFPEKFVKDTSENTSIAKTITVQTEPEPTMSLASIKANLTSVGAVGSLYSQITASNFGDYVDYPVDLNGDGDTTNDWRIFYKNDEEGTNNVFLIAADYADWSKNTLNTNAMSLASYAPYDVYWSNTNLSNAKASLSASKFLYSQMTQLNTGYDNFKAVSNLLNTTYWTNFVNSTYASSAVGSPTVEMFMNSWNAKFSGNTSYSTLNCKYDYSSSGSGYYVGTGTGTPSSYNASVTGYNKTGADLYWPHTSSVTSGSGSCYGYWLASPSAYSSSYVLRVNYDGYVIVSYYGGYNNYGVRPVVSLKSDIPGAKEGTIWKLTGTTTDSTTSETTTDTSSSTNSGTSSTDSTVATTQNSSTSEVSVSSQSSTSKTEVSLSAEEKEITVDSNTEQVTINAEETSSTNEVASDETKVTSTPDYESTEISSEKSIIQAGVDLLSNSIGSIATTAVETVVFSNPVIAPLSALKIVYDINPMQELISSE